MVNTNAFYRPLSVENDEIRLIVLQPGAGHDDIIHVNIVHASLQDKPHYEALSYAWGAPHKTTRIRCSHQLLHEQQEVSTGTVTNIAATTLTSSSAKPQHQPVEFHATTNLESALRHLRYKDRVRTLWVDAICINQKDDVEKGHQIAKMGDIYRQAPHKCLWLGPAADDSDAAMDVINVYGNSSADGKEQILNSPEWSRHWKALFPLVCRSWFGRRWIVQEVALAESKVLFCGTRSTSWDNFFTAMYDLDRVIRKRFEEWGIEKERVGEWDRGHDNVTEINNLVISMKKHGHLPLSNLLVILSKKGVAVEQDAVHAVLGLAEETQHAPWNTPANASTKDVFMGAVELSILGGESLDLMARKFAKPNPVTDLPSWVPQFYDGSNPDRNCGRNLVDHGLPFMINSPYSASGTSKPVTAIDKEKYLLAATGVIVDTIAKCLERPVYTNGEFGPKQIPKSWLSDAMALQPHADAAFETFWRTLVLNRPLISRTKVTAPPHWGPIAKEWFAGDLLVENPGAAKPAQVAESPELDKYLDNLYWAVHNKDLAVTEKKRLGLVPDSVQEGDVIAVLFGCSVPLVLRPVVGGEGEKLFRVIGDAYVHGIMDGEVMDLKEYSPQTITLV